jgi:hypothetical protein
MPDTDHTHAESTLGAHRLAPAAPDEEHVYGACCPGWHTAADQATALDDWIDRMREAGIERVCSLVARVDSDDCDGCLDRYREAFGADSVLHAPLPDRELADPADLRGEILPFLDAAADEDEPVVVHGLSGLGRTGQVLAAWLVHDRGDDPRTAVETVEGMGRLPGAPVDAGNATEADLYAMLDAVG